MSGKIGNNWGKETTIKEKLCDGYKCVNELGEEYVYSNELLVSCTGEDDRHSYNINMFNDLMEFTSHNGVRVPDKDITLIYTFNRHGNIETIWNKYINKEEE